MANAKQVTLLKKSVEEWNEWRENNPEAIPDLQEAYLRGADLKSAQLQEANLIDANLRGATLEEAKLMRANLEGADLRGTRLLRTNLQEADLRWANLEGAVSIKINLKNYCPI